ncbi:MAG: AAA family ATPase [Candidatus Promineifilaceae bacterium]
MAKQKTGNLNPNIPSPELARLMTVAASKMGMYKLKLLTPQLLLRVFVEEECAAHQILQQLREDRGFDWGDFGRRIEMMALHSPGRDANFLFTDDFGKPIKLADELLIGIDEALTIAQARDELKISSAHLLAAMATQQVTTFAVLQRVGITSAAVTAKLETVAQDGGTIIRDYVDEAKKGRLQPYFERQTLLQELLSLLALSDKRHILLVGAEGAGKRTLVKSLALLIGEGKGGKLRSLVEISEAALLEDPLAAMRSGMRRASGGILLVPDLGRFFPSRSAPSPFPQQARRELHKAILGNEIAVVGTLVSAEYERISKLSVLRERSNRIDVPPATVNETVSILNFHRVRLEQEYGIEVSLDAFDPAAKLADQYIKHTALPGAAVQLTDRACALVKMASEGHHDLDEIKGDSKLDPSDVMVAASKWTKIPLTKLNEDESTKYANMAENLHKRIIGQDEAVSAVSRAVKIARVGLRSPKRPIGSFLFLGPSGVGKSELAKALAEFMFGSEDAMIALDMSEYMGEASVNRLIGPPPGYVGFQAGGQLTDYVRENPYTVVLFDEIEKAHDRVMDVLLQVLEEGRLTDGQGRTTTFSETVVIMTSNLGARHMLVPVIGEDEREEVMEEVRNFLRPEFINRIDDVILFHQLTTEQLAKILKLMLKKEIKLAAQQGITLDVTEEAQKFMVAQNDQPEYGARPLRRIISRHLRQPLADFLLSGATGQGKTITVGATEAGLTFN